MRQAKRWRVFVTLALGWGLLVVVLYARQLPEPWLLRFQSVSRPFFLWQASGFALATLAASLLRPRVAGRVAGLYLLASTLWLLLSAGDVTLAAEVTVFVAWAAAAVATARLVIRRWLGPDWATWGLSACLLYAALLPVSFFQALFEALEPPVLVAVAAAMALPGAVAAAKRWRRLGRPAAAWLDGLGPVGVFALGATAISLAVALAWAMTPETESDAIRLHLPYVQQVARAGGLEAQAQAIGFQYRMVYGVRALHAAGYAAGGFTIAKLLSWFSLAALFALVAEEVTRRCRSLDLGVLAAASLVTTPVLLWLSRTLYHDHVITLLCAGAFITLFRALSQDLRGLYLSAALMGCAVQTKYNVLIFATVWVLCLVAVAAWRLRSLSRGFKTCALTLLCLGIASSPWYVYTFFTTGNPFFPYFETLFDSPLWPDDFSLQFNHDKYRFADMTRGTLLFPWAVTFDSEQINQGAIGSLGYVLLALLPFLVVYLARRDRDGLDLALAGLAGLAGIWLRTSYIRYWLPIYPLLLIPIFLGCARALRLTRWRLSGHAAPWVGAGVFLLLLLPLPFWAHRLPWDVYAGDVPAETWLAETYPGYAAVRELNQALEPDDRVLVTGYRAVHTVDADAYDLPYWHVPIHQIKQPAAMAAFLEEQSIDYWVVDHSIKDASFFADHTEVGNRYWVDSRIVSASGSVVIYRISSEQGTRGFAATESSEIEPRPAPDGSVSHTFPRPTGAEVCKVTVELTGNVRSSAQLRLEWLDEKNRRLDASLTRIRFGRGRSLVFSVIAPEATSGRVVVRPGRNSELTLAGLRLECGAGLD